MRKTKRERQLETALKLIAKMGLGMKEDLRDWQQIGRNAVHHARNVLAGKCKACGKPNEYVP